jgi:hypothetical protein
MTFNEGDKYDGIGRIVQELIMKTPSFIVFIDEFGGAQWAYNVVTCKVNDYNSVTNRMAELEVRSRFLRVDKPAPSGVDIPTHLHDLFSARRLIAEAMARLLDAGSASAAHGMLDIAEKWILQRSRAYSRWWMFGPFLILAHLGLAGFFYLVLSENNYLDNQLHWNWLAGGVLGGLGALVSSMVFNRKIAFDATAGEYLHYLEAVLRWTVGFVAGLTVQMMIQGNIMLGFLGGTNPNPVAGFVLSLFAGSSELFFPTLLRRFNGALQSSGNPGTSSSSSASTTPAPSDTKPELPPSSGPMTEEKS